MLVVTYIVLKSSGLVPVILPILIHRSLKLCIVSHDLVLMSISGFVLHERLFSHTKISIIIEKYKENKKVPTVFRQVCLLKGLIKILTGIFTLYCQAVLLET